MKEPRQKNAKKIFHENLFKKKQQQLEAAEAKMMKKRKKLQEKAIKFYFVNMTK